MIYLQFILNKLLSVSFKLDYKLLNMTRQFITITAAKWAFQFAFVKLVD